MFEISIDDVLEKDLRECIAIDSFGILPRYEDAPEDYFKDAKIKLEESGKLTVDKVKKAMIDRVIDGCWDISPRLIEPITKSFLKSLRKSEFTKGVLNLFLPYYDPSWARLFEFEIEGNFISVKKDRFIGSTLHYIGSEKTIVPFIVLGRLAGDEENTKEKDQLSKHELYHLIRTNIWGATNIDSFFQESITDILSGSNYADWGPYIDLKKRIQLCGEKLGNYYECDRKYFKDNKQVDYILSRLTYTDVFTMTDKSYSPDDYINYLRSRTNLLRFRIMFVRLESENGTD